MAGNLFNTYVWLIDLIERHPGITFDEIDYAWQHCSLNEFGVALSKRTFHNHRHKIMENFGIKIESRSAFGYYIAWSEDRPTKELEESLVAQIQLHNALFANPRLKGRISLDGYWAFRYYTPLIRAMESGETVELHIFNHAHAMTLYTKFEPYLLKQFGSEWFVIGRDADSRALCAYAFSDIVAIRTSCEGERYKISADFDAMEFLRNPQLDESPYCNNNLFMRLHAESSTRVRRSRWGSYQPTE